MASTTADFMSDFLISKGYTVGTVMDRWAQYVQDKMLNQAPAPAPGTPGSVEAERLTFNAATGGYSYPSGWVDNATSGGVTPTNGSGAIVSSIVNPETYTVVGS